MGGDSRVAGELDMMTLIILDNLLWKRKEAIQFRKLANPVGPRLSLEGALLNLMLTLSEEYGLSINSNTTSYETPLGQAAPYFQ